MQTVRIAAAQPPEYREDIAAALRCIHDMSAQAEAQGVGLLLFPEGFLQGYLLDEALARRHGLDLASPAFAHILAQLSRSGPVIVFGLIELAERQLFNTAVVVDRGLLVGRYRKVHLLEGERVFTAGTDSAVFDIAGLRFGINICSDTNFAAAAQGVAEVGASLIVCPANNMMSRDSAERFKTVRNAVRGERCRETGLISSDITGARDGRISWGPTALLNQDGDVVAQLPLEQAGLLVFDVPVTAQSVSNAFA